MEFDNKRNKWESKEALGKEYKIIEMLIIITVINKKT